jgi:hypothetical protein
MFRVFYSFWYTPYGLMFRGAIPKSRKARLIEQNVFNITTIKAEARSFGPVLGKKVTNYSGFMATKMHRWGCRAKWPSHGLHD